MFSFPWHDGPSSLAWARVPGWTPWVDPGIPALPPLPLEEPFCARGGHVSIRALPSRGAAPPNQDRSARSSVLGACVLTAGGCPLGPCGRLCLPAGCTTVCAESPRAQAVRRGRWRLGEPRRTPPWLWASLVCPWVTSRSFLVTAFPEGNPSRSGPALSPAVPPASAVSSLFDSSEVPCPRLLLGQQDGRPVQ